MIGNLVLANVPYYDSTSKTILAKRRPMLVIGQPDATDYTVLPLSTIGIKANVHKVFDVEINPAVYPLTRLNRTCYIRTHKSANISRSAIESCLCNLKAVYPNLFLDILVLFEDYCKSLSFDAL